MRSKLLIIPVLIALLPLAQAATLIVGTKEGDYCDYSKIQAAIDAAEAGDTILVDEGTYCENLDVNKRLTLRGMRRPVVSGGVSGNAVTINADGVVLEGFEIKNSGIYEKTGDPLIPWAGVQVNSKGNTIRFNHLHGNCCGIFVNNSTNNSIDHNEVESNSKYGIYLLNSSKNNIYSNEANFKSEYGIYLLNSSDNNIQSNHAKKNTYGVYLLNSSDNNIQSNYANSNSECGINIMNSTSNDIYSNYAMENMHYGIYLEYSIKNKVLENYVKENKRYGIVLTESKDNQILKNDVIRNKKKNNGGEGWGIQLLSNSSRNNVSYNHVEYNGHYGICLYLHCNYNEIIGNTLGYHENYCIYLKQSNNNNRIGNNVIKTSSLRPCILINKYNLGNCIYGNKFFDSTVHDASVDKKNPANVWDGNYYSWIDCDLDGICKEYQIPGDACAVDYHPLGSPDMTAKLQWETQRKRPATR